MKSLWNDVTCLFQCAKKVLQTKNSLDSLDTLSCIFPLIIRTYDSHVL